MHIIVKIIKGNECTLEVEASDTVLQVKEKVARKLEIPVEQQKLVLRGKTLQDNKTLAESGIGANTKLFLVLKKTEIPDLWAELFKLLSKHFTDKDARLVLAAFKLEYKKTIDGLSLDDIERIAVRKRSSHSRRQPMQL